MCYECIGLPVATRICDIRVVTAASNVTIHLLTEYFSIPLFVNLPFLSTLLPFFLVPDGRKHICTAKSLCTIKYIILIEGIMERGLQKFKYITDIREGGKYLGYT